MTEIWIDGLREYNMISALLMLIMAISILQGLLRGASRSAGRLFTLFSGGLLSLLSLVFSVPFTMWIAPRVQQWLSGYTPPLRELSKWEQLYYTLVTAVRDFPLMRFAVVFILSYWLIRSIMGLVCAFAFGSDSLFGRIASGREGTASLLSRLAGAGIGGVIGAARCLMVIAVLFILVTLFPNSSFSRYVEASPVYQQGARTVIEPLTGELIKDKLPVFTRGVGEGLEGIHQWRYEVIDAEIPRDIEQTAAAITVGARSDEEKARLLYEWIGTRVAYDYDKVRDYEEKGIWNEQTPQMTYDSKRGVCIDYSRLYAVMARSLGLQVKVVTGLGYDGRGGYGPHAWNEVYLSEKDVWVPLDATWARSGDWFNPPAFNDTHIADKVI
ncbi:transglutaminase-like domain-containing protein [Paenibacillus woosongensis]|uniref:Transglutaminase-like domain-containing protein n=1 Tax=Paenibacillus woosongensis TaxID=307580 RepID=A0AA95L1D0_9BACL|nr:transglutaminase-like domain-containing protein [Paenibacillus woosongensis]WHX48341.1 transglutaminase-like domain-containing protein [Paenibacillus woosongensis]